MQMDLLKEQHIQKDTPHGNQLQSKRKCMGWHPTEELWAAKTTVRRAKDDL